MLDTLYTHIMWMPLSLMLFLMTFFSLSSYIFPHFFFIHRLMWMEVNIGQCYCLNIIKTHFFIAMKIKACCRQHIYTCDDDDDYVTCFSPFPHPFFLFFLLWEIFHFLTIDVTLLPFYTLFLLFFFSFLHFHTTHNIYIFFLLFTLFC